MIRKFTMVAALAVPAGLFAQTQLVSPNPAPLQTGPVVAPSANIYVIGGVPHESGVYITSGGTVAPESTPGISLADRAGISLNQPVESGLTPAVPVYGDGYGYSGGAGGYPVAVAETPGPSNDLGPSYFGGSAPDARVAPMSLAEIAELYRTSRPKNARVQTNLDVPADAEESGPCDDLEPWYLGRSAPSESNVSTSLGEIAAQYRANRPKNVRTYTNADALRLSAGW